MGDLYKNDEREVSAGVNITIDGGTVKIGYTDANYFITPNQYIKVDGKIFKIETATTSEITIKDDAGLLPFTGTTLTAGTTLATTPSFTLLEAQGVAISSGKLLLKPNEDGIYQSFGKVGASVNNTDTTKNTEVSGITDGKIYADIMSFDTKDGVDELQYHTWKSGNNIYFSQIILL